MKLSLRKTAVFATLVAALFFAGTVSADDPKPGAGKPDAPKQDAHAGHDHAPGEGHDAPKVENKLSFFAENEMHKADCTFKSWKVTEVTIPTAGSPEGATATIEIDLASVDAGNGKLSAHLKSPDFFNVEKSPKATIKVHDAKKTGDNMYTAQADVTLVGVTKTMPVEFKVTSQQPLRIQGAAILKRSEFNIYTPYDPSNGRSPKDEVKVWLDTELAVSK